MKLSRSHIHRFLAGAIITFAISAQLTCGDSPEWPRIRPIQELFRFDSIDKANLKIAINSETNKPLYILECYSLIAAPKTQDFMYSGDFECRLHLANKHDRYSTLLTELPNASRDWESRGRFFASQLIDHCAEYPDLGRKRSFRLRGFELTLTLSNVTFDPGRKSVAENAPALKSFAFEVRVSSDPTAVTSIAASPKLPPLRKIPNPCRNAFDSLYLQKLNPRGKAN